MIEKMKFLSITGPKRDFDRAVKVYLSKYNIHLENALSELSTIHSLKPFVEVNPYKEALSIAQSLIKKIKNPPQPTEELEPAAADNMIHSLNDSLEVLNEKRRELKRERQHYDDLIHQIDPFRNLDYDIQDILKLEFIDFRFGKIPYEHYNKFIKYVYANMDVLFFECDSDRDYVWGIYFVPASYSARIDAIYASLHFERLDLPDEYDGTPETSYRNFMEKCAEIDVRLDELSKEIKEKLDQVASQLVNACHSLDIYNKNFDVRKMAACTKEGGKDELFYILCGWIVDSDVERFVKDISNDPDVFCTLDDEYDGMTTKPPTKLRNLKLFKPFELFVNMYGHPAYNEIDPTSFVAITYSLIFGIMFGDLGQGLCIAAGAFLLYKIKKNRLAAIISVAGLFSAVFGAVFGSVFGYEDLIKPLWLSPMHNVMTVLMTSVGFGMILILIAMVLNIINCIKERNFGKALFDTNGVSGLVFYGAAISCVALVFAGKPLPAGIIMVLFFGIPLLLLFLREPLIHLMQKKKMFPEKKGMFFVEAIFELFEVVLSYVTNTISFLRMGAFALSHAAMMGVVMLLSGSSQGKTNLIVVILGNLFVVAMEGLVVGIQVLRLEYYEMFSRFYKGTGKEFKPYKNNQNI